MKVRVSTPSMADLIAGLGATTVTMPFGEVTTSLERGVIDCGITGTLSGNTAKLFEVTSHLYPLYSGWSIHFTAISKKSFDALDPRVQKLLLDQYAALKDRLWATVAEEEQDGINCSIGKDPCKYGIKGKMTLNPLSAEDLAAAKKVASSTVVPNWAKRCGQKCTQDWLATVGQGCRDQRCRQLKPIFKARIARVARSSLAVPRPQVSNDRRLPRPRVRALAWSMRPSDQ